MKSNRVYRHLSHFKMRTSERRHFPDSKERQGELERLVASHLKVV
ncbi:hypothetical protein [Vibrio fluminensis]|nr:hypothetical protein [Vibrio fluminensis]